MSHRAWNSTSSRCWSRSASPPRSPALGCAASASSACCCAKNGRSRSASVWRCGSRPFSCPGVLIRVVTRFVYSARSGARRQPAGRHHGRICLRMAGRHDDRDSVDVRGRIGFASVPRRGGIRAAACCAIRRPTKRISGASRPFPTSTSTASSSTGANCAARCFTPVFLFRRGGSTEFLRQVLGTAFTGNCSPSRAGATRRFCFWRLYASTYFCITLPLKVWNNTPQRSQAGRAGAAADAGPARSAGQPDQSALSLQYAEFGFDADPA